MKLTKREKQELIEIMWKAGNARHSIDEHDALIELYNWMKDKWPESNTTKKKRDGT